MPEIVNPREMRACSSCGAYHNKLTPVYYPFGLREDGGFLCAECLPKNKNIQCAHGCGKKILMLGDGTPKMRTIKAKYPGIGDICGECFAEVQRTRAPQPICSCRHCGEPTTIGQHAPPEHLQFCDACSKKYKACPRCGDSVVCVEPRHIPMKRYDLQHGYYDVFPYPTDLCGDCGREVIPFCEVCDTYMRPDVISDKAPHICRECVPKVRVCDLCGTHQRKDYGISYTSYTNKTEWACGKCKVRVQSCENCGKKSLDCGSKYHKRHDHSCQCMRCIGSPILAHNFKKEPRFFGDGPLFYGFENEFDFNSLEYTRFTDELRQWAASRTDMFHLVHDGSLERGVELVSNPCSFDFWRAAPEGMVFPPIPNRVELGTAGCHIHMSRDAFQVNHLHKMMVFINDHFKHFAPIFGRGVGHYCQPCPIDLEEYATKGEKLQPNRDHKYWYINMKSRKTVEFRMFRAAESWDQLLGYIQLLDSVYHYTKDLGVNSTRWKDYYKYLARSPEYAYVADCLEKFPNIKAEYPPNSEFLKKMYQRMAPAIGHDFAFRARRVPYEQDFIVPPIQGPALHHDDALAELLELNHDEDEE